MARTRIKQIPPGKRPSRLPYCPFLPDLATPSPGGDEDPLCASCGLLKSHTRHDEPEGLHDAQAEHRRRFGDRDEDA